MKNTAHLPLFGIAGSLLFLPLFFVFRALMTVMMKKTEENG